MYHASAGESHEAWMQGLKSFSNILAYAVSVVCVLWDERHLVNVHHSGLKGENLKHGSLAILGHGDGGRIFLPAVIANLYCCFAKHVGILVPSCRLCNDDTHFLVGSLYISCEEREVILLPCFHCHGIKTVVLNTKSCPACIVIIMTYALYVEAHVVGIVGMERFLLLCFEETQ